MLIVAYRAFRCVNRSLRSDTGGLLAIRTIRGYCSKLVCVRLVNIEQDTNTCATPGPKPFRALVSGGVVLHPP